MRFSTYSLFILLLLTLSCGGPAGGGWYADRVPTTQPQLPYARLGWTDREAAAYLAERLTFGATPALVQTIEADPAAWLQGQLYPTEQAFDRELRTRYPALYLPTDKMVRSYPAPVMRLIYTVVRANIQGVDYTAITEDPGALNERLDLLVDDLLNVRGRDRPLFDGVPSLQDILDRQDYGDFNALITNQMAQKLERAVRSEHQLLEVLTDFWYNHFNVSLTRVNETANFIPAYERDVIRPGALGNFGEMLLGTARHPAMLTYLDNSSNNPEAGAPTLAPQKDPEEQYGEYYESLKDFVDQPGLNENYARELLELHTLGADGGYTQSDVRELARILTGWKVPVTLQPMPGLIRAVVALGMRGPNTVTTPTFYFNPEWHDAGRKTLLGRTYPAGRGYEEGEAAIQQLAEHPSTARFVCGKLAARFTRDVPPPALVDALAARFRATKGDLRAVTLALFEHPAFWDRAHADEKLKTPFHYVAAALRLGGTPPADYAEPLRWCTRLGQPVYACQPPTGYSYDRAYWATAGGFLQRWNYAATHGAVLRDRLTAPAFQTY